MAISTISTLSADQQKIMAALGEYLAANVGKGATSYTGKTTAPLSEGESAAYAQALSNLSGGLSSSAQASLDAYQKAITGTSEKDVYNNYMKYTAPQEAAYLKNTTIPTFKESMVPGGTLRSTGTEKGLADVISNYQNTQLSNIGDAINTAKTNATNALQYASVMNDLEKQTSDISAASTLGSTARAVEQAELTAKLNEFLRTVPEASPLLSTMLSYLGVTTSAAYNTQKSASPFAQILSAFASGLGSAAAGSSTSA